MTDTTESTEHSITSLEKTTTPSPETLQLIEKHSRGDAVKRAGMEARATILSGINRVQGMTPEERAIVTRYAGLVQQSEEQRMESIVSANPAQLVHELLLQLNSNAAINPDLHDNSERAYYRQCASTVNKRLSGVQAQLRETLLSNQAQGLGEGTSTSNNQDGTVDIFNEDMKVDSGVKSWPENGNSDVQSHIINEILHELGVDKATTVRSVYDSNECKDSMAQVKRSRRNSGDDTPLYVKELSTNIPGMGAYLEVVSYGPMSLGFKLSPDAQHRMATAPLIEPIVLARGPITAN